jgi:hypothetical protein
MRHPPIVLIPAVWKSRCRKWYGAWNRAPSPGWVWFPRALTKTDPLKLSRRTHSVQGRQESAPPAR